MPSIVEALSADDLKWFAFLRELPAWKFHWIMKSDREERYHTAFTTGKRTLAQISKSIDAATVHIAPKP